MTPWPAQLQPLAILAEGAAAQADSALELAMLLLHSYANQRRMDPDIAVHLTNKIVDARLALRHLLL